jgi:hypothetical protein
VITDPSEENRELWFGQKKPVPDTFVVNCSWVQIIDANGDRAAAGNIIAPASAEDPIAAALEQGGGGGDRRGTNQEITSRDAVLAGHWRQR